VQELKPYIDKNFSVMPERDNTFIAGSGMGGLVALYALCEYPDVFGGAASFSTHWTGQRLLNKDVIAAHMDYLKAHLPPAAHHRVYMDVGNAGQDAFFVAAQKEADAILAAKGYTPSHFQSKFFAGQGHDETFWRGRFPAAIKFVVDGSASAPAAKAKK
jgi:enterochelin esterase-like enzyme